MQAFPCFTHEQFSQVPFLLTLHAQHFGIFNDNGNDNDSVKSRVKTITVCNNTRALGERTLTTFDCWAKQIDTEGVILFHY